MKKNTKAINTCTFSPSLEILWHWKINIYKILTCARKILVKKFKIFSQYQKKSEGDVAYFSATIFTRKRVTYNIAYAKDWKKKQKHVSNAAAHVD